MVKRIVFLFAVSLVLGGNFIALAADDATFISQTAPSQLVTGQTISVNITMQNSGTTFWETNSETYTTYFLGSQNPQGNREWGLNKVSLPAQPIRPGENADFVFTITAPATPGNYNFQWQMVRERLGVWNPFGQKTPNVEIVVRPADEAIVTGQVIGSTTGMPVYGAKVLIEIVASFIQEGSDVRFEAYSPRALWGLSQVVYTDRFGRYRAAVKVADFIPSQYRYARILVSRLYGIPVYEQSSKLVALPSANTTYQADFTLSRLNYGARFIGSVRDGETGERIPASIIYFAPYATLWTASTDGEFYGVLPLSGPTQVRRISIHPDTTDSGGLSNGRAVNGIAYEPYSEEITFTSGQTVRRDVLLKRKTIQTAIFGSLIDNRTSKPIPNALIGLSQAAGFLCNCDFPDPRKCTLFTTFVVTDSFGRYLLPVSIPEPSSPSVMLCYLKLYTNGGFFPYGNPMAPYMDKEIDLGGKVEKGDIVELNISLDPR